MRQICLDTETTGFDPQKGDRICEIACIELVNFLPTGAHYHQYINPNRAMPDAAYKVHGLSDDFLKDKPLFIDISQEFLNFIQDSPLIIHNASFDMKFLNAELRWAKQPIIDKNDIIDTLIFARQKFPGSPASLDALCKRFGISLNNRTKHGALIDTELLAEVYLNLFEGRSPSLKLSTDNVFSEQEQKTSKIYKARQRKTPLLSTLSDNEKKAHKAFIDEFKSLPLWLKDA